MSPPIWATSSVSGTEGTGSVSDELRNVGLLALALLSFSAWIRVPRGDGRIRRWEGDYISTHVVLLMLPGLGLWAFTAVGQLIIGDSHWILLLLVPAFIGTVLVFWGLLFLPIPRWFLPRDVKARAKARDA